MKGKKILLVLALVGFLPGFSRNSPAQSTVYLKPADALKILFKDSEEVIREDKTLGAAESEAFKKIAGYEPPKNQYSFFLGRTGGKVDGYALIDEQIGKVMPITFVTRINPDGQVAAVEVMVYRESHGGEVASRRFLNQFKNRPLNEELRLYGNIVNISGATLSSQALVTGVQRARILWRIFYGNQTPP